MTSKKLLEKANKAYKNLEDKGYDKISFISGYIISYAEQVNKTKNKKQIKNETK